MRREQANTGVIFIKKRDGSPPEYKGRGEYNCIHCGKRNAFRIFGWFNRKKSSDSDDYIKIFMDDPHDEFQRAMNYLEKNKGSPLTNSKSGGAGSH